MKRVILIAVLLTACEAPKPTPGQVWVRRCTAHNGSTDIALIQCTRWYENSVPPEAKAEYPQ